MSAPELKNTFHGLRHLGTGSAPSHGITTLQASHHVTDRPVASTPLQPRPLNQNWGHHYQGLWRLPGPDSHRQATVNLPSSYVTTTTSGCHGAQTSGRTPWVPHVQPTAAFSGPQTELCAVHSEVGRWRSWGL